MATYKARNGTFVFLDSYMKYKDMFVGSYTDHDELHQAIFHRDGTCNSVDDPNINERDLDLVSLIPTKPQKLER